MAWPDGNGMRSSTPAPHWPPQNGTTVAGSRRGWPRMRDDRLAAAYPSLGVECFRQHVGMGGLPAPPVLGRRRLWDRLALDGAVDQMPCPTFVAPRGAGRRDGPGDVGRSGYRHGSARKGARDSGRRGVRPCPGARRAAGCAWPDRWRRPAGRLIGPIYTILTAEAYKSGACRHRPNSRRIDCNESRNFRQTFEFP